MENDAFFVTISNNHLNNQYCVKVSQTEYINYLLTRDLNKSFASLKEIDAEFLKTGFTRNEFNSRNNNEFFVTNANIKRTLFDIDKSGETSSGLIYKTELNFLNKLEKQSLLQYKYLFEFPEDFLKKYRSKIIIRNSKKFIFNESSPAYHSSMECLLLNSDFINFQIPEEIIYRNEQEYYEEWFKTNYRPEANSALSLSDAFKERHYLRWKCFPIKVDYNNSGVIYYENLTLPELELIIDQHLVDIEIFINSSSQHKDILNRMATQSYLYRDHTRIKSYNTVIEGEKIVQILELFEINYKRPLLNHLREYYRIKFNPKLIFGQNILVELGFKHCSTCLNSA